jgi:hypothetical protein
MNSGRTRSSVISFGSISERERVLTNPLVFWGKSFCFLCGIIQSVSLCLAEPTNWFGVANVVIHMKN